MHLRILLLLLSLNALAACGQRQAPTDSAPVVTATATTPAPRSAAPLLPRQRTMAHQAAVDTLFPYNIPLLQRDGTRTTSAAVFDPARPTVVLYWLTTCMPCMVEMRAIKAKYAAWQQQADFNLIAVSTDWEKNADRVFPTAEQQGWPWPVYHDTERQFRLVLPGELNGLPQSFIFDRDGQIVYHKRKYRPGDEDALFAKLQAL